MPPLLVVAGGMITYVGIKLYRTAKIRKACPSSANEGFSTKQFKTENVMLFSDNQQMKDMNYAKNTVHQDFTIASMSFGLATAGSLFYPPLRLISVFGVSYNTTPIWQKGYKSIVEQKQLNGLVVDSILVASLLLTNHYFLAALTNWLFYLSKQFLFDFKDTFQRGIIGFFAAKELPHSVWVLKNGVEIETSLDALKTGDIIVVNAGKMIPVDGIITKGTASINQNLLTGDGESPPLDKGVGDQVFALTFILSGQIHIQVKKWGKDSYAAKMAEMYL
jgi:cation transport ATPase